MRKSKYVSEDAVNRGREQQRYCLKETERLCLLEPSGHHKDFSLILSSELCVLERHDLTYGSPGSLWLLYWEQTIEDRDGSSGNIQKTQLQPSPSGMIKTQHSQEGGMKIVKQVEFLIYLESRDNMTSWNTEWNALKIVGKLIMSLRFWDLMTGSLKKLLPLNGRWLYTEVNFKKMSGIHTGAYWI